MVASIPRHLTELSRKCTEYLIPALNCKTTTFYKHSKQLLNPFHTAAAFILYHSNTLMALLLRFFCTLARPLLSFCAILGFCGIIAVLCSSLASVLLHSCSTLPVFLLPPCYPRESYLQDRFTNLLTSK